MHGASEALVYPLSMRSSLRFVGLLALLALLPVAPTFAADTTNQLAWDKMRGLLVLHYHVVQEAAATDGVEAAAESVRLALLSVQERMRPKQQ